MKLTIDTNQSDQRLDRFLRKYCKQHADISLSDIYSWLRKWQIKINGRKHKESYRLQEGDLVEFRDIALSHTNPVDKLGTKKDKQELVSRETLDSLILLETDRRLVFNKFAGVVMHPGQRHTTDLTMNDYLEQYVQLTGIPSNETFQPAFCFRLDKDTSGVCIAAKTYDSLQYLNATIRNRQITKFYYTVVAGNLSWTHDVRDRLLKIYNKQFDRSQVVVSPEWQSAQSIFTGEKTITHPVLGLISLVRVEIKTGRLHQIRVHAAHLWFPVLGDIVYGNPWANRLLYKKLWINRQLLHCHEYSFADSNGETIVATSELPDDFGKLI